MQAEQLRQSVIIRGRVVNAYGPSMSDAPGIPDSQILLVQLSADGRMHIISSGQWSTDGQGFFQIEAEVSLSGILLVLTTSENLQLHAVADTTLASGMSVDIGTINPETTIATNLFLQLYSDGLRDRSAYNEILTNVRAETDLMNPDARFIYRPQLVPSDSTAGEYPFHSLNSGNFRRDQE
ncbi:MAG TPA: hypothetical protein VKA68_00815 [bacterium]|nr:hypothetical protein [bacterium]